MKAKTIGLALGAALLAAASVAQADMDTQRRVTATDSERTKNDLQNEQRMNDANAKGPHMSPAMSKALKAVMDAGSAKDWGTATARLNEARALSNQSDFDAFELTVVTAYVAVGTGDTAGALATYKSEIANPLFATALPQDNQIGTLKNAMVLSNNAKDYDGTIALGQKLIAMGSVDEGAALALAIAYYGKGDYATAQSLAQKTIDVEVAAGKTPNATATEIVARSKAATKS
jgi:hypothetical protein